MRYFPSRTPILLSILIFTANALLWTSGVFCDEIAVVGAEWLVPEAGARMAVYFEHAPDNTRRASFNMDDKPGRFPRFLVNGADTPLPYSMDKDGKVLVDVPAGTRVLWAYFVEDQRLASQRLDAPPPAPGDYATTEWGDAWDFEEGDQEGIITWGDRPDDYGEVTVHDGLLSIPIVGDDPYFIWGPMFQPPSEQNPSMNIDSNRYAMLSMEVRATAGPGQEKESEWSLYFAEDSGRLYPYDFKVPFGDWRRIDINLKDAYPGVWDGRIFRALRIDTTNKAPGALVEIRDIRLLPLTLDGDTPIGEVSRQDFKAGEMVRTIQAEWPESATAGGEFSVLVNALGAMGQHISQAPILVACVADEPAWLWNGFPNRASAAAPATVTLDAPEKAGEYRLEAFIPIDIAPGPRASAMLRVEPAAPTAYRLTPTSHYVPIADGQVDIRAEAIDTFGNVTGLPSGAVLKWNVTGDASIEEQPSAGEVVLRCSPKPLTKHTIEVSDGQGRRGETEVLTLARKANPIRLNENGYFVNPDGGLYLPLGGFYANWPSASPDNLGRIVRSVDLFPCGNSPYTHGFPWPPDVERKVADFLKLCRDNGVTALRLMLRNMDLVGRVDEVQLKAVFHMMDMAAPYKIKFNIVLFEDYDKPPYVSREILESIVLPRYTEAMLKDLPAHRARFLVERRVLDDPASRYREPDAIACQKDYLDELLPQLAGREEIFCYEFENEMVAPPTAWIEDIAAHIRGIDPVTPILFNELPCAWPVPWERKGLTVNLSAYHPYNSGQPGADYGGVIYAASKWMAAGGIPFFTGEGGVNQSRWQPETQCVPDIFAIRGTRDQIWLSLMCGANGAMIWTPMYLGEYGEFAKVRPALDALGADLLTMKRARPALALVQPRSDEANQAVTDAAYKLLSRGVDFDVVPPATADAYALRWDFIKGLFPDPPPGRFAPVDGYQAAYLVDEKASQAIIYLRNTAGGVQNLGGEAQPCYLRAPKLAIAAIALASGEKWTISGVYDLDLGKIVPARITNTHVFIADESDHDYVVCLKGAR